MRSLASGPSRAGSDGSDQIAPSRSADTHTRAHPAAVMASIVLAVGIWIVIYAVSGRVTWFWSAGTKKPAPADRAGSFAVLYCRPD